MKQDERYELLYRLRNNSPYPSSTELIYHSPFELLIAVLLSAQSTDISVNKVTCSLFQVANTPRAMLSLGVDNLKDYIRSIGLFNRKAKSIIETCRLLLELHQGNVPEDRFSLENLPGVGRKTANVILNVAFSWPSIAVDTHVFRVCNRTGLARGKNVRMVEEELLLVVPQEWKVDCHYWLVHHGRYTCTARRPRCSTCLIEPLCEFREKQDSLFNPYTRRKSCT